MANNWTLTRFRSAWLTQNLDLLVLKLLRESTLSEWEILSRLHSRYGLNPTPREFARLERDLTGKGFASFEQASGEEKFEITSRGLTLLSRMEEEYRSVVACAARPESNSNGLRPA